MKKLFLLFSMCLLLVTSCKKETVDVTDLLKTVPSSAAGVMVFDMEAILSDADCKVKDHQIMPGKEIKSLIDKASSPTAKEWLMLFENSNGVEPKGAVLFYDSKRVFLTFALYDEKQFCDFVEKKTGLQFASQDAGVKICGNVAVKGEQAWICLTAGKKIDADAIASYYSLATQQSFLVTEMGEKLLVEENDVRGWALLDTFTQQILDRSQRNLFSMVSSFLFENPQSIEFKVDFKKGELEAEAIILNEKGKPAKYQLPAEKVNVEALKTLGANGCDAMMAFTINSKLVKKLAKVGNAIGGALFGDLEGVFQNVDGTVGLVTSGQGIANSLNGFITTKGELSKTLKDMVSENVGPVSMDGKLVRFSKGDVKGALSVEECAEELKGCCLGIIWNDSFMKDTNFTAYSPSGFASYCLKFKPESGGLELDFEAKTSNPSQNSLITILNSSL